MKEEKYTYQKRRKKTAPIYTWHDWLCGNSQQMLKKLELINEFSTYNINLQKSFAFILKIQQIT